MTSFRSSPIDVRDPEGLAELEGHVHRRLGNQVRHLEFLVMPEGLVLMGQAATYHAKQLAQQVAMEISQIPIVNAIDVCPQRR